MPLCRLVYILPILAIAPLAHATVSEADAQHLVLDYSITLKAAPATAYANAVDVAHWWSSEHTYSGDAKNLHLDARAGGCWCEKWQGGSVQHMSVLSAMPGKLLRLSGGLGPLQAAALNGTLSFNISQLETGGSEIKVHYVVAGFFPGGLDKVAGGVDQVLGAQVERLRQLGEGVVPEQKKAEAPAPAKKQ